MRVPRGRRAHRGVRPDARVGEQLLRALRLGGLPALLRDVERRVRGDGRRQSTTAPKTFVNRQWVVATMQYSATTKTTTSFLNGITMTAKGPDALAQNSGAAWSDLYIGQKGPTTSADYKMQGYIGDILVYNSVLSTSDRMSVEAWLSEKYGFGVSV